MKPIELTHKLSPLFALLIGVWYFCIRILGYHLEYIPGDQGDSRFINYLLEHGYQWLSGNTQNFWDAGFMYPYKHSIAFSDSMLGTVPLYSLWRILGFCPETAYQLWWISICILNYCFGYYVFKKWFKRSDIAVILAYIFAFSVFNLGQLNYMQMIVRFMVPIVFYAAYKIIHTPSFKYLFLYCAGIILQFYCALYTGFYLFYFSLLFMFIYCVFSKKRKELIYYFKKENILSTSLLLVISVLLLLWLLLPYLYMSKVVGLRRYKDVIVNLPILNSFLFPHESSLTWRFLFKLYKPNVNEWWLHYLFIGLVPFLVMLFSPFYLLYMRVKKIKISQLVKSLIISSLIIVLLHIRTESGLSFYALIFKFPGINSMRVLNRFMHVEICIVLILLGYILLSIKHKYILPFALLIFADNLFSPDYIPRQLKAELIERKEKQIVELKTYNYQQYKAVALIDTAQVSCISHLDMMLASQIMGIKTVNGYSSSCPDAYGLFFKRDSEEGLSEWLENQKVNKKDVLVIDRTKK